MDEFFSKMVFENIPKVNKNVMEGLATTEVPLCEEQIHLLWKTVEKNWPAGLKYLGYKKLTPIEEFNVVTQPKKQKEKPIYEMARSDIYMVKYDFSIFDQPFSAYYYLIYTGRFGITTMRGVKYNICPVLTDRVIAPETNNVFLRLLRDKLNFLRTYHSLIIDGKTETSQVIYSKIYHEKKTAQKKIIVTKAESTIVHYLVCKYGLKGFFQQYLNCEPLIGYSIEAIKNLLISTKSKNTIEDYVICESIKLKPKSFKGSFYKSTSIKILIPKNAWNEVVKLLVTSLFYTIDNFPEDVDLNIDHIWDKDLWIHMLGKIHHGGINQGIAYDRVVEHLDILDFYLDEVIKNKLMELKLPDKLDNFYDLIFIINKEFNKWVATSKDNHISMYGKSLEVLYYMLYPITCNIFKLSRDLRQLSLKKNLDYKTVTSLFRSHIRLKDVFSIKDKNIAFNTANTCPNDHPYYSIIAPLPVQKVMANNLRGKKNTAAKPNDIHISAINNGSVCFLSKGNPNPSAKINPFIYLNEYNTIIADPELVEELDKTEKMFKGITNNNLF